MMIRDVAILVSICRLGGDFNSFEHMFFFSPAMYLGLCFIIPLPLCDVCVSWVRYVRVASSLHFLAFH
jgi:hypothetical protein